MKDNRIYSFFVVVALLFWNPILFYLLYNSGDIPGGYNSLLKVFIWTVFAIGLFVIVLLRRSVFSNWVKNLIFSVSFLMITFGLMVGFDSFLGLFSAEVETESPQKGLIYEPNTVARYSTVEFEYEARINSLGLRDREVSIDKGDYFRILAFGDSWTFGWGVDVEKSWPRQLENYLHSEGYRAVQVINCGRSGQYTTTYRQYMEKIVPLLNPDLVLVGVLQGDDLSQLYLHNFLPVTGKNDASLISTRRLRNFAQYFFRASFPNVFRALQSNDPIIIQRDWEVTANAMISNFTRSQKLIYNILDDTVRTLFETGNLNPYLLYLYVDNPERCLTFNQVNNRATVFAANELKNDFEKMLQIAEANFCELIFLNLPYPGYTGHKVVRTPNSGVIENFVYHNNIVDSIYQSVALHHNLHYIELTDHFKGLENKQGYFFKFDGHPNEHGYLEIARYVGQDLIKQRLLRKE